MRTGEHVLEWLLLITHSTSLGGSVRVRGNLPQVKIFESYISCRPSCVVYPRWRRTPHPSPPGPGPPSSRAEARTGLGVSCVRVDYTRAQTVHEYAAVQAIQYTRAILQQLQLLCDIVYLNFFLPYCEPVLLLWWCAVACLCLTAHPPPPHAFTGVRSQLVHLFQSAQSCASILLCEGGKDLGEIGLLSPVRHLQKVWCFISFVHILILDWYQNVVRRFVLQQPGLLFCLESGTAYCSWPLFMFYTFDIYS